jgi:hypothetical protein
MDNLLAHGFVPRANSLHPTIVGAATAGVSWRTYADNGNHTCLQNEIRLAHSWQDRKRMASQLKRQSTEKQARWMVVGWAERRHHGYFARLGIGTVDGRQGLIERDNLLGGLETL